MFGQTWTDASRPPVGSGSYASWFVFITVVILAVVFAEWLAALVFKR